MAVNMYGNISGFSYRPTEINLFEIAKQQENKQPVRFCDTEAGKNMPGIKVNISEEGLRALHGSKLPGSVNIKEQQEQLKYYSEHQPIDSFENQLSRKMYEGIAKIEGNNPNKTITISDKENALMTGFKEIADEIFRLNGAAADRARRDRGEAGARRLVRLVLQHRGFHRAAQRLRLRIPDQAGRLYRLAL